MSLNDYPGLKWCFVDGIGVLHFSYEYNAIIRLRPAFQYPSVNEVLISLQAFVVSDLMGGLEACHMYQVVVDIRISILKTNDIA